MRGERCFGADALRPSAYPVATDTFGGPRFERPPALLPARNANDRLQSAGHGPQHLLFSVASGPMSREILAPRDRIDAGGSQEVGKNGYGSHIKWTRRWITLFAGRDVLRRCMKIRTVGSTTFAANHRTEPCPSGRGPFRWLFRSWNRLAQEKLPNKANLDISQMKAIT